MSKNTSKSRGKFNINLNILAQTICGTPPFMSPEIYNHSSYNFNTDIWSVSVMIFYIFTNKIIDFKTSKNLEKLNLIKIDKFIYNNEYYKILYDVFTSDKNNRINCKDFLNFWIDILKKLDKNYFNKSNNNIEISNINKDDNDKNDNSEFDVSYSDVITENEKTETTEIDTEINDDNDKIELNNNEIDIFDLKSFLTSINLVQYENIFINNGFDDINFLIENGIENEDFNLMNITNIEHIEIIRKTLIQIKNLYL
jgi:serine/threonine protein kinase